MCVCVCVVCQHCQTSSPLKPLGRLKPNVIWLPWDGGTKLCSNGPGYMTKMADMPIYGKNLKKSSSPEQKSRWPWNLVCSIGCSSTIKFIQMMTLGWPRPILRQGQIWFVMLLYGKKLKRWIFQKLLWFETSKRWPKWKEVSVDIKTLSPDRLYAPCPGAMYMH